MNASKTLASAVAAVAVVGAIGMAYAQTPDTTTTPAGQTMQNQVTTPDSAAPTAAAPTTTDTTGFQAERPAQADRN